MKIIAYTISGQTIGIDILTWDNQMLNENPAFIAINDNEIIPSNYIDISSVENWDNFGGLTTLSSTEIKTEILKLISDIPTPEQYLILEGYDSGITIVQSGIIDSNNDILFNTPRSTSLPSLNVSYSNVSVLGSGGPDLSNLTTMAFTWDLDNKQLNSFNFSTSDGQPGWWVNLMPLTTETFDLKKPDLTIQGSNIVNFDGDYWINYYNDGIALVSKSGTYSIYFSGNNGSIDYIPKNFTEKFIISKTTGEAYSSPNNFNFYGSEYNFVKLSNEQSATSNSYQTISSLNVTNLPLGNYKIIISHRYGISVTNNEFHSRILLNNTQLGNEFISRENRNVNRKFNQFNFIETLNGDVNIDLQYYGGSGTAYISDIIIEIFRVN